MDENLKNKDNNVGTGLENATKLTPLELNNIKLDIQHTILTPDYLEKIEKTS